MKRIEIAGGNIERLATCQICGGGDFVVVPVSPATDAYRATIDPHRETGWCLCRGCSFVFQNLRLSRQGQAEYYRLSGYRIDGETGDDEISEGYKAYSPIQLVRKNLWLLQCGVNLCRIVSGTCLDYGCGIGGALEPLAKAGNRIYGVELDEKLVAYGRAHFNVTFASQLEELPPDLRHDLIFSHHSLVHVYDPNELAAYAGRTLKDDGVLFIVVPSWHGSNSLATLGEFNTSHNAMFDHVSLARLLNAHGLFLCSHLYANLTTQPGSAWEISALAIRSDRRNVYAWSPDDVLREITVNIAARAAEGMARQLWLPESSGAIQQVIVPGHGRSEGT